MIGGGGVGHIGGVCVLKREVINLVSATAASLYYRHLGYLPAVCSSQFGVLDVS